MLLLIYSYYKILAIFPMVYNIPLNLSHTQWFVPSTPPMVTTSLFSVSVSLLFWVIFRSLFFFFLFYHLNFIYYFIQQVLIGYLFYTY